MMALAELSRAHHPRFDQLKVLVGRRSTSVPARLGDIPQGVDIQGVDINPLGRIPNPLGAHRKGI